MRVGAGRRQVGLAELALDQRQRDPLVKQLHSVGMPELVRGQAPAHPGVDCGAVQLKAGGGGRSGVAAVGELQALLISHPTRERLADRLMLALYRSSPPAT